MRTSLALAAVLAMASVSAQAATISVTDFSKSAYDAAVGTMSQAVVEDFESFGEGNVADGWSASAVGAFSSAGGVGSGGTVNDDVSRGNFAGNDGALLAIRDGNVYGRSSTTSALTGDAEDNMFLDSNDTFGISWVASLGGQAFNRILLTMTDAAEFGAIMRITVGDSVYEATSLGNANPQLVDIRFETSVTVANILFEHQKNGSASRNDGFSLDDITLSAVPLPAGAWLLLSGFGALSVMRRRRGRA
ncbi:MAG: VPLPA-CTERM sorting domain-containing protein [Pseudomonadota bacterium]